MKLFQAAVAASFLILGSLGVAPNQAIAAPASPAPTWTATVSGSNLSTTAPQPYSGAAVGDLFGDGRKQVIVGFPDGSVHAWFSNGSPIPGWPRQTGGAVHAAPTLADLNGDGKLEVIVSSESGGVFVLNGDGTNYGANWPQYTFNGGGDTGRPVGWFGSIAVADIRGDGGKQLVGGAWDHHLYAWDANGSLLQGYPKWLFDTIWDTPTLVDLDRNGQLDILIGSDWNTHYWAFRPDLTSLPGWPRQVDQVPWASSAAADLEGDGETEVIAGTGLYFPQPAGQKTYAFRPDGSAKQGWPRSTNGRTFGSPAVGDLTADGKLEVVQTGLDDGALYVWQANGSDLPGWPLNPGSGPLLSSPSIAPVDNSGRNGVWVGTADRLRGYKDNATEAFQVQLAGVIVAAPTVADLGSGQLSVIAISENGPNSWRVYAFPIQGATSMPANAWPTFHGNMQRTGTNLPPPPPLPPPTEAYWLVAADGGIFSFGNAQFYGSTGGLQLRQPIVGMAATPGGLGYWLVASDGGVFAFGNAGFHGSTGGISLRRPIAGIACTPSGNGYWMVASDGGIFAFGDAGFYGSTGGMVLNQPIVGMAATKTGKGYWLVASDGGLFAFGDAAFHGSTGGMTLNKPIVGMAATKSGNGYWLVASDGGIFSFGDAVFHGSTGGLSLVQPIVEMSATPGGNGYWLVASDGGIFSFGDARFYGSTGGLRLRSPIVGMTSS